VLDRWYRAGANRGFVAAINEASAPPAGHTGLRRGPSRASTPRRGCKSLLRVELPSALHPSPQERGEEKRRDGEAQEELEAGPRAFFGEEALLKPQPEDAAEKKNEDCQ